MKQWVRSVLKPYWQPKPPAPEELTEAFCRAKAKKREIDARLVALQRDRDLMARELTTRRRGEHPAT